jgi:hypothetical protein
MRRSLDGKQNIEGYIQSLTNSPEQTQSTEQSHADGGDHRKTRTCKGQHPSQAGTPVSGDQVPVRVREGALPRTGQKNCAITHDVCAVQPFDGAVQAFAASARVSASAARPRASMRPQRGEKSTFEQQKSIEKGAAVSCCDNDAFSGLRFAGFEHHPEAGFYAFVHEVFGLG